jgi:Predicted signal transduction protein with a C-terminal ATPase domain
LHIMKKRLGERLAWKIDLPATAADVPIPKLLVQPVVENAIVHGVEENISGGTVTIAAWRETQGDEIVIEVSDNGAGMSGPALQALVQAMQTGDVPSAKGSGVGLVNVERRLRLSYAYPPGVGGLQIDSREGEGTTVRIAIPGRRRETT